MRKLQLASLSLALIVGGATVVSAQADSMSAPSAISQPAATPGATAQMATPSARWSRHHHARHMLFRGVKLTSDQRAKLATIRQQYRTEAKPLYEQVRSTRAALRAARAQNDTAAVAAARAKMRDTGTQFTSLRSRWMSDARGVLTSDQQARFDQNAAALKAAHRKHEAKS